MNEQQPATSLAEFVAGVTDNLIPASTRARAARVVADTLGVMLRGSVTADASRMIAGPHPEGASSIVAPGFPVTDAREAMLLNALSTCTAELDEGARPTGHPAMHVLPPLLAAAQRDQLSGARSVSYTHLDVYKRQQHHHAALTSPRPPDLIDVPGRRRPRARARCGAFRRAQAAAERDRARAAHPRREPQARLGAHHRATCLLYTSRCV